MLALQEGNKPGAPPRKSFGARLGAREEWLKGKLRLPAGQWELSGPRRPSGSSWR